QLIEVSRSAQPVDRIAQVRMLLALLLGGLRAKRHRNVSGVNRGIVGFGRNQRRVRTKEYEVGEPGFLPANEQPFEEMIGKERRLVVLGGELGRNEAKAAIIWLPETSARTEDILAALEIIALGEEIGDPGPHVLGQVHRRNEAGH